MTQSMSLENYLRVIYQLQQVKEIVRIKDIAKSLKVKTSSVVEAVKKLHQRGLVHYEKHGYIKLTQNGLLQGYKLYERYRSVFRFLTQICSLTPAEASRVSCGMEHFLSDELAERFDALTNFFIQNPDLFEEFLKFSSKEGVGMNLSEMKPGERLKVVKLSGSSEVKKRLLNMGIIPGEEITVERVAPLGDPIEVKVKGYRLSLRKEEARSVIVEKGE